MTWVALMLAGCGGERLIDPCAGQSGTCVSLQIEKSASVTRIDSATIHVAGGVVDSTTSASKGRTVELPIAVALLFDHLSSPTTLAIDVSGVLAGQATGTGHTSLFLSPGQHAAAHVELTVGSNTLNDMGGPFDADLPSTDIQLTQPSDLATGAVLVTPSTADVAPGRLVRFTANRSVVWSISEGSIGGTIDSNGNYLSPSTTSSTPIHIVATSVVSSADVGSATVTIHPARLDLVAGMLGAAGNIDGVGNTARVGLPSGLAWDSGSNVLYFGDGKLVRKYDSLSGSVTTIAGNPNSVGTTVVDGTGSDATFGSAKGLVYDGTNLWISDYNANRIRKLVLATGAVTTVAGNGAGTSLDGVGTAATFGQPAGMTRDPATGLLYIVEFGGNVVRVLDPSTMSVTTLAGDASVDDNGPVDGTGSAAHFDNPTDVTFYAGALYIAEAHAIRKVAIANAAVTTIVPGVDDATGVVASGFGDIYYAEDDATQQIFRAGSDGSNQTSLAGAADTSAVTDGIGANARFGAPSGVTFDHGDNGGNLYIGDTATIRRLALSNDFLGTIAGLSEHPGSADGTGAGASFSTPRAAIADNDGNLYVADEGNNTIRKIVLSTGVVTTIVGTAGVHGSTDGVGSAALLDNPTGVAIDESGNLYIVTSNTIRKVKLATNEVSTIAGTAAHSGASDGPGTSATFYEPEGAAYYAGALYVADGGNHTVRKIDLGTDTVSTIAGLAGNSGLVNGTGSVARFNAPNAIAADINGNLYIAESVNHVIRKLVIATGGVTTLAGNSTLGYIDADNGSNVEFNDPVGLTVDRYNSLYVTERSNHVLRRVSTTTGATSTEIGIRGLVGVSTHFIGGWTLNAPVAVTVLPNNDVVVGDEYSILTWH